MRRRRRVRDRVNYGIDITAATSELGEGETRRTCNGRLVILLDNLALDETMEDLERKRAG
jgi:hypothetical protein